MKTKETILAVIALTLLIGFRVAIQVMYRDSNAPRLTAAQQAVMEGPKSRLRVQCRTRHSMKDFQAIQIGMTLAQAQKAFRFAGFSSNAALYLNKPDVLVRFIEPDGSSNEIVLHAGKIMRKQRFSAEVNRMADEEIERLRNGEPESAFR